MLELKIPGLISDPDDRSVLFLSFVDHFLRNETDYLNLHLFPFWQRCPVCHMDLDFVGKVETSRSDTEAIIEKLGLPKMFNNNVNCPTLNNPSQLNP